MMAPPMSWSIVFTLDAATGREQPSPRHRRSFARTILLTVVAVALSTVASAETKPVTTKRLLAADAEAGNWLTYGRTYDEQRHSPLSQIGLDNIDKLSLAWSYEIGTLRGIETTPLIVDGILYGTGSWSIVFALDAATGRELWRYGPEVPKWKGRNACCDVVNRGVATPSCAKSWPTVMLPSVSI